MRTDRPIPMAILCFLVAYLPGCATHSAPRQWLRNPAQTQTLAVGGWMDVQYGQKQRAQGELIAVHPDSLFILAEQGLIAFAMRDISRAKVTAYSANHELLAFWTIAGIMSTLSHGIGLVLSAPLWIIFGTVATISQSHQPQVSKNARTSWDAFAKYARFPRGIPKEIDRNALTFVSWPGAVFFKGEDIDANKLKKGVRVRVSYYDEAGAEKNAFGPIIAIGEESFQLRERYDRIETIAYQRIIGLWRFP